MTLFSRFARHASSIIFIRGESASTTASENTSNRSDSRACRSRTRRGSRRNASRSSAVYAGLSAGMIHWAVRWKSSSLAVPVDDGRGDLNRRRSRTDDPDPGAVERNGVVPARAVEQRAAEGVQALEVGVLGVMEHAGGCDHHVDAGRDVPPPSSAASAPRRIRMPPPRRRSAHVARRRSRGPRPRSRPGSRFRGRHVAPLGIEGERIAVEVRRNVAGEAGIGVLPPRPPEPVGLLVQGEVGDPRLAQLDGGQDPRHPPADDGDTQITLRLRHPCRRGAFDLARCSRVFPRTRTSMKVHAPIRWLPRAHEPRGRSPSR